MVKRLLRIVDIPYTKESVEGNVYEISESTIKLHTVNVYDQEDDRWDALDGKAQAVALNMLPQTVIIKDGKLVSPQAITSGDRLQVMLRESIYGPEEQVSEAIYQADAYMIIIK